MPEVMPIRDVEALFEPARWAFAEERQPEIAAYWADAIAGQPHLFDGIVLLQHEWRIEDSIYRARYMNVRYSAFMAWRHFGFPGQPLRNGFAMAALRSNDGAFLLGEMGAHTAHPGKIYFAAGTPDMSDVVDGKVDLAGSVLRELEEETGLAERELIVADSWILVTDVARAAFMRPVTLDLPAVQARELMLERMTQLPDQELADIVIVRGRQDFDKVRMPPFMIAYLDASLPRD